MSETVRRGYLGGWRHTDDPPYVFKVCDVIYKITSATKVHIKVIAAVSCCSKGICLTSSS
jgi:hypothetical protein